jgi:hypothetical protein
MMDNSNRTAVQQRTPANAKGCMHLAPGGELIMAAMSVLGWVVFVVKFAVI